MTREEKAKKMRQQIINSAIIEFGNNSYTIASLNMISKNGGLSKGIIYHYFENKDDLYLECVNECFTSFVTFLNNAPLDSNHVKDAISNFSKLRYEFFKDQPEFLTIFTNALLQPPQHLILPIKNIKAKLDEFNMKFYKKVLQNVTLRDGVSVEEAIEYFLIFQDSFNYQFKNKPYGDFKTLFQEHEIKLSKFLNIMIYGIAKEER